MVRPSQWAAMALGRNRPRSNPDPVNLTPILTGLNPPKGKAQMSAPGGFTEAELAQHNESVVKDRKGAAMERFLQGDT